MIAYVPLFDPLPIWVNSWFWPALLAPLCAAVAIVYKSIKNKEMSSVPREASVLFVFIIGGMALAALALAGLSYLVR